MGDAPAAERDRLVLEASGLGTWEYEPAGRGLVVDARGRALLGLDAEAPLDVARLLDHVHPDDRDAAAAALRAALASSAAPLDAAARVRTADGGERWVHVAGRVVRGDDADGRPLRLVGTLRDDTRARAAERALAERDERLRAALFASRTGTFRWDIRTNALDWDENLDRLFGLVPGETVRSLDGFLATVHPDDRARVVDACARCARDGADFDEEFRVVWPDGSIHWLDDKGRTFRDAAGAPAYMTGACVEVTERRRADEERDRVAGTLRRQRAMTAALSGALDESDIARVLLDEAMPVFGAHAGCLIRHDDGRLHNIAWRGYAATEMVGWVEYPARLGTPAGDAALSAEPVFLEDFAAWQARYPQWLDWVREHQFEAYAGLPLRVDGRVVGVLVLNFHGPQAFSAQDRETLVSFAGLGAQAFDRASLYRAAVDARRDAEKANDAKSAFLATMSHELRTPLNAIGGYVDILELGIRGPVTDAQLEDLSRIRRSQRHLLGLINDVLDFAKIGAGTVRYALVDVAVARAVAAAEVMIAPQAAAKGLRVVVDVSPADVVRVDPEKLQQVLLNLLGNAVKFTGHGGTIAVTCDTSADARTHAIRVRDTGCGVPRELQESIFEAFVQLDRDYARPSDGVGLGLAISRQLVRGMGGDLTVESAVGVGSTFTLLLPRGGPSD